MYMYHLAIFFFTAGFLYNEKKYGRNVTTLFAARMHSIMPQYILYSMLHMLLRNWMIRVGLYNESIVPFNLFSFIQSCVYITYFAYAEQIGSAFWFLPVLITAIVIWGTIVSISNHFCIKYVNLVRYVLTVCIACLGLTLIKHEVTLAFRLEDSLLVLPIIAYGHEIQRHQEWFLGKMKGWIASILLVVVFICPILCGTHIELSKDQIINPFIFYFISWAGVTAWFYFSFKLSLFLHNTASSGILPRIISLPLKLIGQALCICGNYSLDIMALHLLVVKLIDYIYLEYINPAAGIKSIFVYSVRGLWPFYLIFGIILPIIFRWTVSKIIECLKKIFPSNCVSQQNIDNG